ncbi:MAG: diaminopimelate epimerase [Nitriliruptoraceae bacterium]
MDEDHTLVSMRFTKAHGTGNDFVVIADFGDDLVLTPALVVALTDRRNGIGGDGVLRLGAPSAGGDVFMDYRNADGSVVEMCGNGVRVVAKHVLDHGLVAVDGDAVLVETRAGLRSVQVERGTDGRVIAARVDMGRASFDPSSVPFVTDAGHLLRHDVDIDGTTVPVAVVSMGNPHAVVVVDDVATAPVAQWGARLQAHDRFPEQVNVGFARPTSRRAIDLRVYERGVGETASCGTGACAAVSALHREGLLDDVVDVHVPGGVLEIDLRGSTVVMSGPVEEVAHGEVDAAWLRARGIHE